ncbi:c-type cytochrome [Devosia ureilytica]|uniref:Cytochrome c n=2 Tax=Devosia ureilytica TaxID=2952754 RepID=A0A9Q4APZ5_9HYPH|nr:cytochrome c [Devosia ureilytica]MCP8887804.1 cytochrome c [Devosia ureilytica]
MHFRMASVLSIAIVLAAGAAAVFAQDAFVPPATPEEAVSTRQALMREDGGILRSLGNLSGAEAVAAMTTIRDNYSHIPALFPEGSIVGDTDALPAIWENWEAFTAIVDTGVAAAEAGIAAAQAGDAAGYTGAVQTLMGTCGQCHQQFRS